MNMDEDGLRITFSLLSPEPNYSLRFPSHCHSFYITYPSLDDMHRRATSAATSQRYLPIPRPMGHYPPLGGHGTAPSHQSLFLTLTDIFRPRKARLRATFFCLFSLIIVTTYVCFVSPPALSPGHPYRSKLARLDESWRKFAPNLPTLPGSRLSSSALPDISLSPEQELSALTAFMAALPQNVIPTNIDPAQPIDPQLVLDFDTRTPQAEKEIDDLVIDVWISNPVVLFSKVREHPPLLPRALL